MGMVTVIGAGLAGLLAARRLRDAGVDVVVRESGRVVGGRLATVDMGGGHRGRADMGAQFFTVRSERFRGIVDDWLARSWVYEWCRGFGDPPDGYPRYAATGGMAELAAHLAQGLDVRLHDRGASLAAPVIATPPLPGFRPVAHPPPPHIQDDPRPPPAPPPPPPP